MSTTDIQYASGNGDIETTFWAYYNASSFWEAVDSSYDSYIARTDDPPTTNRYALFSFPAFSVPAGNTISNVKVIIEQGSSAAHFAGSLKVGGTRYYATDQSGTGTKTFTWTTNPQAGGAWTPSQVNRTGSNVLQQMGVRLHSTAGSDVRSVYVSVTHAEPPAVAGFSAGGAGGGTGGDMSTGFSFGAA